MVMLMPMIVLETCVAFPIAPLPEGSCHEVTEGREWEGWPKAGVGETQKKRAIYSALPSEFDEPTRLNLKEKGFE